MAERHSKTDNIRLVRATRAAQASERVALTLMVACYNEADNILATLRTLVRALAALRLSWEVIVIDDASRDASAVLVEAFLRDHDHLPLRLVSNSVNVGLAQ